MLPDRRYLTGNAEFPIIKETVAESIREIHCLQTLIDIMQMMKTVDIKAFINN